MDTYHEWMPCQVSGHRSDPGARGRCKDCGEALEVPGAHRVRTDGQHSNEFCTYCFVTWRPEMEGQPCPKAP